MEYVVSTTPRLRQRVVPAFGRLAPPEWQTDSEFDLLYHVRRLGLPTGATMRDLLDLAPVLVQTPFDRTRPLWEFTILEGLPDGRAALLQKMHHTITDGEGGIRMSERIVDLTSEADDPEPVPWPESPSTNGSLLEVASDTFGHVLRRGAGFAQRSAGWLRDTVTHPAKVVDAASDAGAAVQSFARQVLVADPARSPLWSNRTLQRQFEILDVPFDDAKRASKNLGGSLNDFFVCGAASAAGAYHHAKGVEISELRMAMPVSFRHDRSAGGNSFAPTRVLLPVSGGDLVTRFEKIRDLLTTTKTERAIALMGALAGVANLLPTSLLVQTVRQQAHTIDFTTSNLRAAPFELYISGALIEGTYPLGPTSGTAWNLTMMTYCGSLNMGLHVDRGAVEDPELLRHCLEEAYAELVAAGA
jgi:WS/DGAT/MGAT family acyltransferase